MRVLLFTLSVAMLAIASSDVGEIEARAIALKSKGDAAGALAAYEQAAALDPKSARFQDEIGFLLAVLNRRDEAVSRFKRAIELDPRYAPAHFHLGVAFWLAEDQAHSIPELDTAAALDP